MSVKYWALALLAGGTLYGQQDRLRLDDILKEAVKANPDIQAARKRWEAAQQRPAQATSLPETMLSLGYSSSGSPRPLAGIGVEPTANAGVMVTQEFPFPGKRKLRGDIARREADAGYQRYLQSQLTVVARVKEAYHKLHHAYEVGDLLAYNSNLLRRFLEVTQARYSAGKAEQQDVLRAATQLSMLETKAEKQRLDLRSLESRLNALMNRPSSQSLAQPVSIPAGEFHIQLEALIEKARLQAPMLMEQEKMIQREELSLNLARKDALPDYSLSAGYFNMGSMPDMYQFRVDFKLPNCSLRKQRAMVAEGASQVVAARHSYSGALQNLFDEVRQTYLMAESSFRLIQIFGKTIGPQSNLTLESSIASYEAGKIDFLNVISNQMALLEAEQEYHMQMLEYHLALIRLEELTGEHLIDEEVL